MAEAIPEGIETELTKDTCRATGVVNAPPEAVFDYVRRPANHAAISGDQSVQGNRVGAEVLEAVGDRFGMSMKLLGLPYRITNKVVAYEEGQRIAWTHAVGHTWTWTFEPTGDDGGQTTVTETFDLSTAKFPPPLRLMGYPKGHVTNVAKSVANVRAHFSA